MQLGFNPMAKRLKLVPNSDLSSYKPFKELPLPQEQGFIVRNLKVLQTF